MIRRKGGAANTNIEGEYRILLTAKPDAALDPSGSAVTIRALYHSGAACPQR
jgi:hypothetical protein